MTERKINEIIEAFCTARNLRPAWVYQEWVRPLGSAAVSRMTWNNWVRGRVEAPRPKIVRDMVRVARETFPAGDWRQEFTVELMAAETVLNEKTKNGDLLPEQVIRRIRDDQ